MRHVVIVAPERDEHACVVAKRVQSLGAEAVIVDTAEFPRRWRLAFEISKEKPARFALDLDQDGVRIDDETLSGVWWRRPRRYVAAADVAEVHFREYIVTESREAFEGWLLTLGRRVINPPAAESAARKILQLQKAVESGLDIPESLFTNSPERAEAFYEAVGPDVVFKPFTAPPWTMIATQRMTADALAHLPCVAHAPVIFQEQIPKVADIRVTVVDDELFAVKIRSKRAAPPVDWRIEADCEFEIHALPARVADCLLDLMKRLGLRFAACDLALTSDGRHVFLEANPGGQWLFAEILLGLPVSTALARALLQTPRQSAP
jgi:hypothetical protein